MSKKLWNKMTALEKWLFVISWVVALAVLVAPGLFIRVLESSESWSQVGVHMLTCDVYYKWLAPFEGLIDFSMALVVGLALWYRLRLAFKYEYVSKGKLVEVADNTGGFHTFKGSAVENCVFLKKKDWKELVEDGGD